MDISSRLKILRAKYNISQANLAKTIGVSPGNVGDWERGRAKPGADALVAISSYFNVSVDWLLTGNGKAPEVTKESDNDIYEADYYIEEFDNNIYEADHYVAESPLKENRTGVIQHSCGAGKSFTMLYFLRNLLEESGLAEEPPTDDNIIHLADRIKAKTEAKPEERLLTETEYELIEKFKLLDEENRGRILERIDMILEIQGKKSKTGKSSIYHNGEHAATKEVG